MTTQIHLCDYYYNDPDDAILDAERLANEYDGDCDALQMALEELREACAEYGDKDDVTSVEAIRTAEWQVTSEADALRDVIAAEEAAQAVRDATDLDELCEALNALEAAVATINNVTVSDYVDLSSLPNFGGQEPSDTSGLWSWDANRVLVYGGPWQVEPRRLTRHGLLAAIPLEYDDGSGDLGVIVDAAMANDSTVTAEEIIEIVREARAEHAANQALEQDQ